MARRDGRPLAAIMADIDHFKRFNDAHGHEAGDRVLRMTARVMADHFRQSDVVCRYGGEEFLILMPGATAADAVARADAFRRALAGTVGRKRRRGIGAGYHLTRPSRFSLRLWTTMPA